MGTQPREGAQVGVGGWEQLLMKEGARECPRSGCAWGTFALLVVEQLQRALPGPPPAQGTAPPLEKPELLTLTPSQK